MDEAELRRAGARGVRHNAPLGREREAELVSWLVDCSPATVVDLGCGNGELLRSVLAGAPTTTGIGVDNHAPTLTQAQGLTATDRLTFELADAASWRGTADAAICVGASHAFGDSHSMFVRVAEIAGCAVVGDGCWSRKPDSWCTETFGDLPDGLGGLADVARRAGWVVEDAELSTLDEWDAFEHAWAAGVRGVGSSEAITYAERRLQDYRQYRGVLGFGWLQLTC